MRVPIIFVTVFLIVLSVEARRFKPTWDDLDTRILPEWYDRAKVGIILHWGVYSVPGFYSEWFWQYWSSNNNDIKEFMKKNYRPNFTYQDFAPEFRAEFYDPEAWTKLFVNAGAKYVILTSKHHEGFALFPACRSYSWNAMDVGPKRDLVGDLAAAVRKTDIKFGLYHSLFEWFNPIYNEDATGKFNTNTSKYPETKLWPELKQLINDYKPSVFWSDGSPGPDTYWKSTSFLAYLYNDSPVKDEIVVNDRWGDGTGGKHGDFYDFSDRTHYDTLQKHKWESIFTIDKSSWGYRRNLNADDILSIDDILKYVVTAVSCGGNALINVGPTKEGTISPIFQERLLQLGNWLKVNGGAIYDTSPWFHQKDSHNGDVWYTCSKTPYNAEHPTDVPRKTDNVTAFYAITVGRPKNNLLELKDAVPFLKEYSQVHLMEGNVNLKCNITNGLAVIEIPYEATMTTNPQFWVLKFTRN